MLFYCARRQGIFRGRVVLHLLKQSRQGVYRDVLHVNNSLKVVLVYRASHDVRTSLFVVRRVCVHPPPPEVPAARGDVPGLEVCQGQSFGLRLRLFVSRLSQLTSQSSPALVHERVKAAWAALRESNPHRHDQFAWRDTQPFRRRRPCGYEVGVSHGFSAKMCRITPSASFNACGRLTAASSMPVSGISGPKSRQPSPGCRYLD